MKKLFSFGRSGSSSEYAPPRTREAVMLFHWQLLLGAFFLATIFVFVSSFVVYRKIGSDEIISSGQEIPVSPVPNLSRLDTVLGAFETKRVTFEQMTKNRTVSADPSI